jgi:Rieske Fe-S protein
MADDAKGPIDVQVNSPGREGLTGTAPAELYRPAERREAITIAPDFKPIAEQPAWRQDFPIDWPQDQYVERRDFVKFLVLTSGAFTAGQFTIAAQSVLRDLEPTGEKRIASIDEVAVDGSLVFEYPHQHDICVLVRRGDSDLVAYSQKCTHLSCAVVPRVDQGVLHCPCHQGYFDLATGRNIAGPPPRPLPVVELVIEGDDVYAVAIHARTS